MALITTPAQLKQQGEFYLQLATMTKAGLTIVRALETVRQSAPNHRLRMVADRLVGSVSLGETLTHSMKQVGGHLAEFDIALIEAGETSGRLDQCLKLLGEFYQERGHLAGKVISALVYPVFLLHFAVLIFPTSLLADFVWKGQVAAFLADKLSILLPLYALVLFLIWTMQADRGRRWRSMMENLLSRIPLVGATRRDLAMARLSAALEALINAGVTIIEAWDIAARASGSQRIERAVAASKPRLLQGELPSDAISAQRVYPELFTSSYRAGEISGMLDDALRRMYRYYMEAATAGLQRLASWLPKIVYFGVVIAVGYQIMQSWMSYFKQINDVMGP